MDSYMSDKHEYVAGGKLRYGDVPTCLVCGKIKEAHEHCCGCHSGYVMGCRCMCHGPGEIGYGVAQQARAPGKMFSRSDILAILRADHAANGGSAEADAKHHRLVRIFENLE